MSLTNRFVLERDVLQKGLLGHEQVPDHFKELFIISGYRVPGCSLIDCCVSVFKRNNETLNFWTHFLPAVYFCYITYCTWVDYDVWNDAYTWPLVVYMIGLCIFPLASAVAHVFNTLSDRARHICFFLDYAALSFFTVGVSIAYKTYIFPSDLLGGLWHQLFLPLAAMNAVVSLVITCQTRFMPNSIVKKVIRISAFALPYIYDSAPVIYRIAYCAGAECYTPALYPHTYQFIFGALATIVYVAHVPERFVPGRFDIVGHSHQFFHVFTIVSAYLQMSGLMLDMRDRRHELLNADVTPAPLTSVSLMLGVLMFDACVLRHFIRALYRITPSDRAWSNLYGVADARETVVVNGASRNVEVHAKNKQL